MLIQVLFELCSPWLNQVLACTLWHCPLTSYVHTAVTLLPWATFPQSRGDHGCHLALAPVGGGISGCAAYQGAPNPACAGAWQRWLSHVFCVGFLPLLESPSAEQWG